jgi:DNA mismatch endonuclease (patch repair protein)
MADKLSPAARSANMARVRGRHTRPEMVVRRLAHGLGYRYRLHGPGLPGKPDLVFRSRKKVIFVHGCFWHQHANCHRASIPVTNRDFWSSKLRTNAERDAAQITALIGRGFGVLVIWECETTDAEYLAVRIRSFLDEQ